MNDENPTCAIDGFTLELLRAGNMLHELAVELGDAISEGEEQWRGAEVIEMISGSILSYLDGVDEAEVERATELIGGATERVIEHLRLALELRRRMDAADTLDPGLRIGRG